MSRPKRKRLVAQAPRMEGFKPFGIPISDLEPVVLLFEEFETIRLLDYEGLTQAEAAERMVVSRPTLTRIYEKARRTIAMALVEGKAIFIEGGDFHIDGFWYRCESCFHVVISQEEKSECPHCHESSLRVLHQEEKQKDQERMNEKGGFCICLACNYRIPHQEGVPCRENLCPGCGKSLIREGSYHHRLALGQKDSDNL